jgi:hypothetical protein
MPNTTSASLKLTVQATGENSGTWGQITNTNLLILEQAIGGYAGVALNATTGATLTFSNGALSDGKNQVLKLTGTITTNVDVIVPDSVEKTYVVENATSGAFTVTVKTTSGSGVTWGTTDKGKKLIYSDGTDILEGISSIDTLKVSTFTSTGIDDNATSTAITIDSSERVGIGTSFSSRNLPSVGIPQLQVEGANTGASTVLVVNTANDTTPSAFALLKARGSSVVQNSDEIGRISFNGWDGSQEQEAASISAFIDTFPGAADMPGRLVFKTTPNASATPLERMRIDSSGNVGIGTSSPSSPLDVVSSGTNNQGMLKLSSASGLRASISTDAQDDAYMYLYDSSDALKVVFRTDGNDSYIDGGGDVGIGTSSPDALLSVNGVASFGDGTALLPSIANFGDLNTGMWFPAADTIAFSEGGTEVMRIDSSGNVGIGTTSPSQKLSVTGSITCSGGLTATGNITSTGATNAFGNMQVNGSGGAGGVGFKYVFSAVNKITMNNLGNMSVSGALSKGSGSFKIDHPLPSKSNTHNLVHSFIEAPQADNIYRGKVDLVNGTATVNIDTVAGMSEGTFILLNREIQCFTSNETGWTAVKGSVSGNTLTITAQDETCTNTISWLVIGERQDQHMYDTNWTDDNGKVIVEPLKETEE